MAEPFLRAMAASPARSWTINSPLCRFASESCGLSSSLAIERAQDAVSAIEGGLVIARVSGNGGPFIRAIESLPERFMLPPQTSVQTKA